MGFTKKERMEMKISFNKEQQMHCKGFPLYYMDEIIGTCSNVHIGDNDKVTYYFEIKDESLKNKIHLLDDDRKNCIEYTFDMRRHLIRMELPDDDSLILKKTEGDKK